MKKYKLDFVAVRTAIRTAGALMIGNAFIAPLLLGNRNWAGLAGLMAAGFLAIIATSLEPRS